MRSLFYWSKDDVTFIVEVPELGGCVADGEKYRQALSNVEIAIDEWVEFTKLKVRDNRPPKGKLMYA